MSERLATVEIAPSVGDVEGWLDRLGGTGTADDDAAPMIDQIGLLEQVKAAACAAWIRTTAGAAAHLASELGAGAGGPRQSKLPSPSTARHNGTVETLGSKQVYANAWMTVREDAIRRADGSTGIYAVVDSQDIALIIAAEDDRLHLVQQYRYPVAGRRWEFPAGRAPRFDLEPRVLAARELREETGLCAGAFAHLGTLDVAPGMSSLRCWVFLATGLTAGEPEREHEEQDMCSRWYARTEVQRMIAGGAITDAKSIAAYALLLLHERGQHD